MVRRGQQTKRALRRESKLALEQLDSPHGRYTPPNRDDCFYKQWEISIDDLRTIQLQFNIWRFDGQLVDFAVLVQRLGPTGWVSVERFDCCHGHCHHHADNEEANPRSILTLNELADVEQAFLKVEEMADERARIIRDKGA
ncbi:hypothetical protein IU471_03925 [Nocardia elegans]|uniref:hypothetical protein n=1 Tax=Nocardia elegans TaxID=300029 RepID=UPI001895D0EA|nr:hypothetical protein [Nocardia elegans]MBF6242730.1 hypothetical protein [Nocardia elegans]